MTQSAESDIQTPDYCASRLRLTADPARLGILLRLQDGPATVGQLLEKLPMAQNLMSHHLRVLKDGGLIAGERQGRSIRYALTEDAPNVSPHSIDLGCCRIIFSETETA